MAKASPETCALIKNDQQRLDCYDNIFNQSPAKRDIKDEKVSSDLSANEMEERLFLREKNLLEKEVRLQKKEKELDLESERRWFGFTKRIQDTDNVEEIKISSQIETVATKINFQLLIILDNGQHWQSVEKFRRHKLKDGYDVEITKGFLSGFALRVPGTKIKIRVRRIK
tara:strand:+ start:1213 stop:1722 length:510 start_codon:yes stop_codon:yes gene_type:complete